MIINHNIAALNTYRQLSANGVNTNKSLEKLSSGLRINRAGDDAAGLAISEKMRAQIRGLDQASRNSQDGISMIQTAEGGLNETHAILQRMRELANQAANDTNVGVDRGEIQKEMNQLSSEINRIGNTTEFNTQALLKGDGKASLDATGYVGAGTVTASGELNTTEATQKLEGLEIGAGVTGDNSITVTLNGKSLTVNLVNDTTLSNEAKLDASTITADSVTVRYEATAATDVSKAIGAALNELIKNDADLAGNFKIDTNTTNELTIAADKGGAAAGAKGSIADAQIADFADTFWTTAITEPTSSVGTTTDVKASTTIDLSAIDSVDKAKELLNTGITINGTQIEFYNADAGAYTGDAIGINISHLVADGATFAGEDVAKAIVAQANGKIDGVTLAVDTTNLKVSATAVGPAGNGIEIKDGGVQENFKATFQVGANKGQSMTIDIKDMRASALGITAKAGTAGFVAENIVTNGTDDVAREVSLDVSSHKSASAAIKVINDAIESVSAERSKLGAFQNRLEHTINNLGTSSENLTAAESRIRDVDMAQEMMEFTKQNILSQAAQAMLAQANQQPQGVLQLLR